MPTFTCAGSVTRQTVPGGPLSDLSLHVDGSYEIVAAGPGAMSWRTVYVEAPYVDGSFLVAAAKGLVRAPLTIRVYGSSHTDLRNKIDALLRAFEQFSYQLTITIDGQSSTWDCMPADYAAQGTGEWDGDRLRQLHQDYTFQIPRQPNALAGPD